MREEDESNIRGGETDMDLYTPVDSLVMASQPGRPVCPWCDHIVTLNKESEWECEHCHMVFRHWEKTLEPEPAEKRYETK